jgi:hypothetical protein
MELQKHDETVWTVEQPIRLMPGVWLKARTTVLQMADGGLLVFSPVPRLSEVAERIRALGPVKAIIAPNIYHHMGVPGAMAAFPGARVFGSASLRAKRADIAFTDTLEETAPALWEGEIDQLRVLGMKKLDEFEFFHRRSQTLVLTDLVFNLPRPESALSRFVLGLTESWGRFAPSKIIKRLISSPAELRETVVRLIAWNPQRVVVSHGDVVEQGAVQRLKAAFGFLES